MKNVLYTRQEENFNLHLNGQTISVGPTIGILYFEDGKERRLLSHGVKDIVEAKYQAEKHIYEKILKMPLKFFELSNFSLDEFNHALSCAGYFETFLKNHLNTTKTTVKHYNS